MAPSTKKEGAAVAVSLSALKEQAEGLRRAQLMANLAHVITGPDGSFESWSETLPNLIGLDPDQIVTSTRRWLDLVHPDDRSLFRQTALTARAQAKRADVEYRLRRGDGKWIHVRQVMESIPGQADAQGHMRWFNTLQDVTEQKAAEGKIKRLNRVYAVLSGINSLIVRVRDRNELFKEACRIAVQAGKFPLAWIGLVNGAESRISLAAWEGAGEGYVQLMPLTLSKSLPEKRGLGALAVLEGKAMVANDIANDPGVLLKKEALERGFRSLVVLPLVASGEVVGLLALYAEDVGFFDDDEMKLLLELAGDISFALEHIANAEKLNFLAYYDSITGLANRTLFKERVTQLLQAAGRAHKQLAVIVVDIERFRTVNDSYGRHVGDALLKQFGERLLKDVGDSGRLARLGADYFAAVVSDFRVERDVVRMIDKARSRVLGEPFAVEGTELRIATKAGIALFPNDGADAETLLRNAEAALRKAKTTGEPELFYTEAMTERVAEKLTLENKLRQALEREEFVLHYQPKVDLQNRSIVGVEALIRWQNPELGLVPPVKFIPLLEETGLILQVGSWALKRAALDHRGWAEQGLKAPRVAVNVSPIQLRQRNFVRLVEEAIAGGLAPTGIDLEITESLVMDDIQANIEKLNSVRGLGVNLAVDDFGTGYSSLGYLAKLPVQFLKIDRSFIAAMHDDPNAMTLVSTIISLAHSLRLKVVAEGVEREEQAKFLRLLRCDEMQGYLISKPVPIEQLVTLLRKDP
jgi:diguanylate cyclase (GGDEF)-like protein/PAS domain S-box-containing protein